jgi:hypothetical protein
LRYVKDASVQCFRLVTGGLVQKDIAN